MEDKGRKMFCTCCSFLAKVILAHMRVQFKKQLTIFITHRSDEEPSVPHSTDSVRPEKWWQTGFHCQHHSSPCGTTINRPTPRPFTRPRHIIQFAKLPLVSTPSCSIVELSSCAFYDIIMPFAQLDGHCHLFDSRDSIFAVAARVCCAAKST